MKRLNYTLFFSLVLLLTSCQTAMLFTTVDVLRPAQVEFAPEVENLLIVNNTKVQPEDIGHTIRFFSGQAQDVSAQADSVSLFALSVLTEEIDNINFFAWTDLLLYSVNTNTDFNTINPLSRATVVDLCRTFDADAILSLDHIVARSEIQEYFSADWGFTAFLDVRYESWWSIHYPNRPEVIALHFQDSLFWDSGLHRNRAQALEMLPRRHDALIDGALFVGQNSLRRFLPFWERSDRFFYNPNNRLMKQAMDSVVVQNWEAALEIWGQVFESTGSNRLRAEAANNMAIASEILGDFGDALRYAEASFYIFNARLIRNNAALMRLTDYIIELQQRQREILLLNRQLGIEM